MTRRPDPADAVNAAVRAAGFTPLADIVEALTARRETLDLGQRAAAELIGVTQSTLAGWETRRVMPSLASALAWAHGLGMDLAPTEPGGLEAARRAGWNDCGAAIVSAAVDAITGPYRATTTDVAAARTDSPDTTGDRP